MQSHQRLIIPVAAAFVFIVAGLSLVRGFGGTMAAAPSSSVARAPTVDEVSNEILETAKGLGRTQQQAVDQLQVVQDQLVAQKAETKSCLNRSPRSLKSLTPCSNRPPISQRRRPARPDSHPAHSRNHIKVDRSVEMPRR
jgi:hypothetical protein